MSGCLLSLISRVGHRQSEVDRWIPDSPHGDAPDVGHYVSLIQRRHINVLDNRQPIGLHSSQLQQRLGVPRAEGRNTVAEAHGPAEPIPSQQRIFWVIDYA